MVFHSQLAYSFDPQTGHRLALHLTSVETPEMHFELPSGNGTFNYFYRQLFKAGMSGTEWGEAVNAVIADGRSPQPLPSLDLDDVDITQINKYVALFPLDESAPSLSTVKSIR